MKEYAHTLFIVGSRKVFEDLACTCVSFDHECTDFLIGAHHHAGYFVRRGYKSNKSNSWDGMDFAFYDEEIWDKWWRRVNKEGNYDQRAKEGNG